MAKAERERKRPVGRPRADGRPPISKPRVFTAAAKLIARYGYAGTSLRMIADALGATAPSLSQMFGSKQQLLLELVETLSAVSIRFHEQLEALEMPPAVRLHKMVHEEVLAVGNAGKALMAIFYLPELRRAEFHEALEARQSMISFYRAVIAAGVRDAVFRRVDVSTMAEQVFQLTETSVIATDTDWPESPERLARETAEFVLRGLLADLRTLPGIVRASTAIELTMTDA